MNKFRLALAALMTLSGLVPATSFSQDFPPAGLRPYERPLGAPVIGEFAAGEGWQSQAVRGLGEPLTGVGFLKDQGAWYTPFTRPNLPGRYDLRGLHQPTAKGQP